LNNIPSKSGRLRVNEIFYSIQGESTYAGLPCVFVRLTYCNLRCRYCDTEYAFFEGDWMGFAEIISDIKKYNCNLVEVTGGEPLLQKEVLPFMKLLCDEGFDVLLETAGHMDISGVDKRVGRVMDVKCPSSGESGKMRYENMGLLTSRDQVKFVIGDRTDYLFAKEKIREYNLSAICPVLFSPVFGIKLLDLASWILDDNLPVRMQLQMHKYIWPPETRGV